MQKKIDSVEMPLDILENPKSKIFYHGIVVQEPIKVQKKLFEKIGAKMPDKMGI